MPITRTGEPASREFMELMQSITRELNAANAKLALIAAIVSPTGGATIDSQARTAIVAIKTAAT